MDIFNSLRNKLIAALIIAVFSMALIVTLFSSSQLHSQTVENLSSKANLVSQQTSQYIEGSLQSKAAIIESLAKNVSNENTLKSLKQAQMSGEFYEVLYGRDDGSTLLAVEDHFPADPRVRPWYQGAERNKKTIITSIYNDAKTKELMVTIAHPVINEKGAVTGVIGGDLTLDYLSKIVSEIGLGGNASAMLLDAGANFIAHPNNKFKGQPASAFNIALNPETVSAAVNSGEVIHLFRNGIEKLYFFKTVQALGSEWIIGIEMDQHTEFAAFDDLRIDLFFIVIAVLAVITSLASWLIKLLVQDLQRVSEAMKEIASGDADLTQRIEPHSHDEVGNLARNFNTFVENIYATLSAVKQVSDSLAEQSKSSADFTRSSSERIAIQQNEINMVATAIDELSAATQEIASNAETTAHLSDEAVSCSESGAGQVNQSQVSINNLSQEVEMATNVIAELHKHSQSISSILATIQDIAEQTNLLALNAAIEAARAGEQGRGFAVVADEVRVLSQRTHDSTREIQSMIETLQNTAGSAVNIMNESKHLADTSVDDANSATSSLTQITGAVSSISDMATQIASAAEEQSLVTTEITRNTQGIRDASDQLASEAEVAAAQAGQLSSLSGQLNGEIARFGL